jgi:superfamily II DNA or RNA helicase
MSQTLLTPEQYEVVVADALDWGRRMVRQIERLEARVEETHHALTTLTRDRSVVLDASASSLANCVAVRMPTGSAQDLPRQLIEHAGLLLAATPLIRCASELKAVIKADVSSAEVRASKVHFWNRHRADHAAEAVDHLRALADWATKTGYAEALDRTLTDDATPKPSDQDSALAHALARAAGTVPPPQIVPISAADLHSLLAAAKLAEDLERVRHDLTESVKTAYEQLRDRMVRRRLSDLPVSAIRDASEGRVRTITPLESAGLESVQDVLDRGSSLDYVNGISHVAAQQIRATAGQIQTLVRDDLRARIDLDEQDALLTELVAGLHSLLVLDKKIEGYRSELDDLVALVSPLRTLGARNEDVVLLHRTSPRRGVDLAQHLAARAAWVRASGLETHLTGASLDQDRGAQAWDDFKKRSIQFYGLLSEIVGITVDAEAAQGHLPQEVVSAVNQQSLDTSQLKVSLRGYQAFGARYALVQRRVIVGDEMGLGKTVQALAAMAHLAANGARHFVVVCPPAVLLNWMKETHRHTHMRAFRVHGSDRDHTWRRWRQQGGVAVTTYGTLPRLRLDVDIAMLVVDEAHLIKNPSAQRTQAVNAAAECSERVALLTGTPLENRVGEFRNLISYLQPDVADRLDAAEMVLGAQRFRLAVSPVYLRRNSDDVLTELPDLIEVEEHIPFTKTEEEAYFDALSERGFMAMRQVGFIADGHLSSKLDRLVELVDEAMANNKKVLVFSYFLGVLDVVAQRLGPSLVAGTIKGALSADARQAMIDRFTEASKPGVLLSQIVAGGVGSNLQAASVVILCEPQVKPTLEDQAIKRAHRMGQLQAVQVHRLITPRTVDERLMRILAEKRRIFAEYAAMSEVAEISPDAVGASDAEIVQRVLDEEQKRYADQLRSRRSNPEKATLESRRPQERDAEEIADVARPGAETGPKAADAATGSALRPERFSPAQFRNAQPTVSPRPALPDQAPEHVIPKCNACDSSYDFNGHCRCS